MGEEPVRYLPTSPFGSTSFVLSSQFHNRAFISRVEVNGGSRLILSHARILLGNHVATPPLAKVLLDAMNPIVDLNRDLGLRGAVEIATIRLRDGVMHAEGTTTIPDSI